MNVGDDEFGEEREEEEDEADDDDANEDDAQVEAAPKNIDDGSAESDNNAGRLSDSDGIVRSDRHVYRSGERMWHNINPC